MHSLQEIFQQLTNKQDLHEKDAEDTILQLAEETNTELIGEILKALADKGESFSEILGATRAVLKMARPFPRVEGAVDIVGTGGDGKQTFNISTLAALTVASMGVPVIKHGNRAASSKCGSADLLEAFGLLLEIPEEEAFAQLKLHLFAFLFAPYYHPGFKNVAAARKQLGIRTIFNLLGPLTNPALPSFRLIGVFDPRWMENMAKVLPTVGCDRAWLVHGSSGTDELDLAGENQVIFLDKGPLRKFTITADEVGLTPQSLETIQGGDVKKNLDRSRQTLQGEPGPLCDTVAFNAGVALYLSGQAKHASEGVGFALEALRKGQPWELVERLRSRNPNAIRQTDHS